MFSWLAVLLLIAANPAAQKPVAPKCTDDRGAERCTAAARAKQRAIYRAPPIAQLGANGSEAIRVFYVDGYGRDVGMLVLRKPNGADPLFEFATPVRSQTLAARTDAATWMRILEAGSGFDNQPTPETRDPEEIEICLHQWMVTVEAIDSSGKVRLITQASCDRGFAIDYAFELAKAAIPALPICASLNSKYSRNEVTLLAACAWLEGDKSAAAQVYNQLIPENQITEEMALKALLSDDAVASWRGQRTLRGPSAIASAFEDKFGKTDVYLDRLIGDSPELATLTFSLIDYPREDRKRTIRLRARLRKAPDGQFQITRIQAI